MVEIGSAQELVDTLLNAGSRLVVLDFYSPGCGACRTLHPKVCKTIIGMAHRTSKSDDLRFVFSATCLQICQIAESNPDALFLKVNYEEHRSLCCSLNIRVLPFFRFYRGPQGRVCSFSCTNATVSPCRMTTSTASYRFLRIFFATHDLCC